MPEKLLYKFGQFLFDPNQRELLRDGQRVLLYPKNLLLLKTLIEADRRILSKDELLAAVWPDAVVEEGNLAKNISQLRKALGNGAKSEEFIETIPTIGYRFRAEVTTVKSQNGFVRHSQAVTGQERDDQSRRTRAVKTADVTPPIPVAQSVRWRWLLAGLAVALAIVATAVWLKWPGPQTAQTAANEFASVRLTNHIAVDAYPEYSPDGKKIAFSSNRDGLPAIYQMNTDGSDARRLVNDLEGNTPHWSPDGKKVYFWGANAAYEVNADSSGLAKLPNPNGLLSPDGKKIVMVKSLVEGVQASAEIFVANPDGTELVRLTNNQSLDADPFWSPDGKRIAFACFPDGFVEAEQKNAEICVMNADGGNVIRLTNDPAWDNAPVWSRDGTRILFNSQRGCNGQQTIYVMNADGSNAMRLTDCGDNARHGTWSPDGKKIVYESERDGNQEIYSINADPSHQTNITNNLAEDSEPVWSRNGQQIAFISNRDGKDGLFVMDADGGNQRKLVSNAASPVSWSPDGRQITFAADWAGSYDVYVANADGGGIVQLTRSPANESGPVWSPDGAKILFSWDAQKPIQLFVMKADGSGVTRVSNSSENEWQHDWSPDGKQIVFTRSRGHDVQRDIWMMNADGGNPHLIATSPGNDELLFPRFSPDGQRIAFHRRVASPLQADVWLMNADGSGQTRLTYQSGGVPAWSPDGKKITFYTGKRTGNFEVYVMDVAGK